VRRYLSIFLSFAIVVCSLSSFDVSAAANKSVKVYKNCTELNKVYKGGVARSATVKNKGGKTKHKPYVSKEIYDANKKSDRDKDLIACEK
jgi:hypothetical protein